MEPTSTPPQPQPQPQPTPEQQQTTSLSSNPPLPPPIAPSPTNPATSSATPPPPPPPTTSSLPPATPPLPPKSATPTPPNPNPHTQSQTTTNDSQTRTPPFNRPWQQQQPQPSSFSHYSLPAPPLPLSTHSSSSPSSTSTISTNASSLPVAAASRGGMAIGVPAHHPGTPPPPPTSFSSLNPPSFGQAFGGLGRNVTDSGPASTSSLVRPSIGMGMMGSLGSSSGMRPPPGVPAHQLRPVQSSVRPQPSLGSHSASTQNFQGHGMLRVSSLGSPGSPSPNSSQSPQPQNQPWLSSGSQGKPPLPPTSLRPQLGSQSMQQRAHIPQQHHHSMPTTSQQQQASSVQQSQQPPTSGQPQETYGQQFSQSRIQQLLPNQQQIARGQGSGVQRPPSQAMLSSNAVQSGVLNRTANLEPEETCNRILSKRSIQELVAQIDPSENLDPEVEDILVDIAEDFVENITSFGCSLAKHRKSTTLEAKDILLHLERNWNMTLPGFGGDEIKTFKKPITSDIHRERLAVIKKSILATEMTNSKSSAGQAGGNPKGYLAKGPTSFLGSPNPKVREPA